MIKYVSDILHEIKEWLDEYFHERWIGRRGHIAL